MKPLPYTTELVDVAKKTVWFKSPDQAIADSIHFIAHVLTYGTHEDVKVLRKYLSQEEFEEGIINAPPGIFDPRSWHYWNLIIGRYPPPPLPQRKFDP